MLLVYATKVQKIYDMGNFNTTKLPITAFFEEIWAIFE